MTSPRLAKIYNSPCRTKPKSISKKKSLVCETSCSNEGVTRICRSGSASSPRAVRTISFSSVLAQSKPRGNSFTRLNQPTVGRVSVILRQSHNSIAEKEGNRTGTNRSLLSNVENVAKNAATTMGIASVKDEGTIDATIDLQFDYEVGLYSYENFGQQSVQYRVEIYRRYSDFLLLHKTLSRAFRPNYLPTLPPRITISSISKGIAFGLALIAAVIVVFVVAVVVVVVVAAACCCCHCR
jgi:hypothetical protein